MRKFFKFLFLVSSTLSVIVLTAVSFIASGLPDELNFSDNCSSYKGIGNCLTLKAVSDGCLPASTGADLGSKQMGEISLLGIFPVKSVSIHYTDRSYVVPGGNPFGIKIYVDGVLVISVTDVETENGKRRPAGDAGRREGDYIKSVNSVNVYATEDIAEIVEKSQGSELKFEVIRDGTSITLNVVPALSESGAYKVGIWVRDSCAGIGTVTFIDRKSGVFAGLGHAVCDVDTLSVLPLKNGEIVPAEITGVYKSLGGSAGELCGSLMLRESLGSIELNDGSGVFGKYSGEISQNEIPVAFRQEVRTGKAQILTTVSGTEPQAYEAEIIKINLSDKSQQKNMIIRITDRELLQKTGGIVQGMSGSPIIQDGMLVGAVTHVFVNNPKEGYAIFAENMLNTARSIENENYNMAA